MICLKSLLTESEYKLLVKEVWRAVDWTTQGYPPVLGPKYLARDLEEGDGVVGKQELDQYISLLDELYLYHADTSDTHCVYEKLNDIRQKYFK